MVGMVRWCRNHPRFKEILSGGVGFVRWCRNGPWEIAWDFRASRIVERAGSLWASAGTITGPIGDGESGRVTAIAPRTSGHHLQLFDGVTRRK